MTLSNTLILISIIFTIASVNNSEILIYWMNHYHLINWDYLNLWIQFLLYSFLHWSIFHIMFNSIFLYIFWNPVEESIWMKKYSILFVLNLIIIWVLLLIFTPIWTNTIWISWFALSILAFYTLMLKDIWNSDYKWWITAIIINIMIWFMPWISLLWHLVWALIWVWYFYILKKVFKETI